MAELGTVEHLPYDDGERRRRLDSICECHVCGAEVELWSDTEVWHDDKHAEYGPACGVCCERLFIDGFEGLEVYHLRSEDKLT